MTRMTRLESITVRIDVSSNKLDIKAHVVLADGEDVEQFAERVKQRVIELAAEALA